MAKSPLNQRDMASKRIINVNIVIRINFYNTYYLI